MAALSDFWLLHGFLSEEKMSEVLNSVPEFYGLRDIFKHQGYYGLYKHTMEMPTDSSNEMLEPLLNRAYQKFKNGQSDKQSPDYWAAKVVNNNFSKPYDKGIFSIYFFNIVQLKKEQGIFQDAGIPHAYLEGKNVELMANSDNVLRGGLTKKHIDIPELLRHTKFEGINPVIIEGTTKDNPFEFYYNCPVDDFLLSKIQLPKDGIYENRSYSIEILFVMEGEINLFNGRSCTIKKGEAITVLADRKYQIRGISDEALLYKASFPKGRK